MKYAPQFKFFYDIDLRDKTADLSKAKETLEVMDSFKSDKPREEEWEEFTNKTKVFVDHDVKKGKVQKKKEIEKKVIEKKEIEKKEIEKKVEKKS